MSTTPELPDNCDAQVEWFHTLAAGVRAGSAVFDSTTRESLRRFLEAFLPGHPLSGSETERELEGVVSDVRANEVAWNRALQRVISNADDAFQAGNSVQAFKALEQFANECPWTYFAQVALDQATHYSGDDSQ